MTARAAARCLTYRRGLALKVCGFLASGVGVE